MLRSLDPSFGGPDSATLPVPALRRWQPLRLGLVELFHYDSEEFWFKDGHLLLRGNNGTGKSKVLSLTMPFLLDANLKSSRIEPDGDHSKRMSWNLLMGTQDRRIGYAWIEFGCLSESGEPRYLTLGAGMFATAGKSNVDSWFFLVEGGADSPRFNRDLWLTSRERVALTKDKLREAIQGHGQIFPNAGAYRRAVDERLFRLGQVRYDALIDTLIQLRQPQLSKKPDEGALSGALSESLAPIAIDMLVDVADALGKLQDERRLLEEYQSLSAAVNQFEGRYRAYAGTRTRREARVLRQAQTDFENASRGRNDAQQKLDTAEEAELLANAEERAAELSHTAASSSLHVLQEDPANADANKLDRAAERLQRSKVEQATALEGTHRAKLSVERAQVDLRGYAERMERSERDLDRLSSEMGADAVSSGLAESTSRNEILATKGSEQHKLGEKSFERSRGELVNSAGRRRQDIAVVRGLIGELTTRAMELSNRQARFDEAKDELDEARESRVQSEEDFDAEGRTHGQSWSDHFGTLVELRVEAAPALEAVGDWVLTLEGEHPGQRTLEGAHAAAVLALSTEQVAVDTGRRAAQSQVQELQTERKALSLGTDPLPPVPLSRGVAARVNRSGAPFWRLVDFAQGVEPEAARGLEAALEASGILDAWVTAEGQLVGSEASQTLLDTTLLVRKRHEHSLAAWLVPCAAEGDPVPAALVQQILEGISCAADDVASEAWIGLDGRYRLGPLAGTWRKAEAAYIGATARAKARARRIIEIDAVLESLSELLMSLQTRGEQLAIRVSAARSELQSRPSDSMLRTRMVRCNEAIKVEKRAVLKLEQVDQQLSEAREAHTKSENRLAQDAADLRLPMAPKDLQAVEEALSSFQERLRSLIESAQSLRMLHPEHARQAQRCAEAVDALEEAQETYIKWQEQFTSAEAELEILQSTLGLKVRELRDELARLRTVVEHCQEAAKAARARAKTAGEGRAVAKTTFEAKEMLFQQHSGVRAGAISKLQAFAASGILSAGAPDVATPEQNVSWTIDPALTLARRLDAALSHVPDDDDAWNSVQKHINVDLSTLQSSLSGLGYQCNGEQTDFGLVVTVVYQNKSERPDKLAKLLMQEIFDRSELLTVKEKEVLENHLQSEIAAEVHRLLKMADDHVSAINEELKKHPTSTGLKFRLVWEALTETDGAPLGFAEARKRLLNTSSDLWSPEDRRVVGSMLQQRIQAEREQADAGLNTQGGASLTEQLARALDYRRWHRFRVERWQGNQWRKLSGPASSGERALGLTVPLFAAVASFYGRSEEALAPRLMLLDEAFAGIDDAARAHCMALIREFDLDFIITSEREWACYAELPGVSICQLQRREGVDAVYVSRWTWDGKAKKQQSDPDRRFPPRE